MKWKLAGTFPASTNLMKECSGQVKKDLFVGARNERCITLSLLGAKQAELQIPFHVNEHVADCGLRPVNSVCES